MDYKQENYGYAGKIASAFIGSKLTPILIISALLLGVFSTINLPREEEPQINVPMFDVFVPYYGADPSEIEKTVVKLGERKLWEIPKLEYIYSMIYPNMATFILRFEVGTNPEDAANRVYTKVLSYKDLIPSAAEAPIIKERTIDDVPILALTLSGNGYDDHRLRAIASKIQTEINSVPNVSETQIIGGHKRQLIVHFDPVRMAEKRITPTALAGILKMSNAALPSGHYNDGLKKTVVKTDSFIKNAEDLKNIIVGISNGLPVKLSDIAQVKDGPDEKEQAVLDFDSKSGKYLPAVTISVAKRRGANATKVANDVIALVDKMKGKEIASDLTIKVTRNYGHTAKEKSDELIYHMLLATISVTILIMLTLGMREAFVVLIAIPVTLALTLLVYYLYGYTLNRITLFALIFSIGILVDDAIVVVENINRHCVMKNRNSLFKNVINAVDEVGNPTILATFTVIASILPMAFVRGMMGPYMRPIPVGASFAMLFSLAVAFIVTPWLFARIVEKWRLPHCEISKESLMDRLYRKLMQKLIYKPKNGVIFLIFSAFLTIAAISMVLFKQVIFKTLPFDNKNEFQVVINMPESSSLENTKKAAIEMSDYLSTIKEVKNLQLYIGTSAPYNFNGLVRHYFLRQFPYQADIQVNLLDKKERKRQSHEIATSVRPTLKKISDKYGARIQVAEVPPGPPVLATLVIEVFDKDPQVRRDLAKKIKNMLASSEGIVDVDSYEPDYQPGQVISVDRQKATLNGIMSSEIAQTISMALNGYNVDMAHTEKDDEIVDINVRLPEKLRKNTFFLDQIKLFSPNGTPIALSSLTKKVSRAEPNPLFRKNLQPVTYVTADISGGEESPIYAVLNLQSDIRSLAKKEGIKIEQYFTKQPNSSFETAIKWDGEWQITYEVFRDLGIAFLAVLVLIYILVVAWFEDFVTPLIIMSAIPLALVGIIPAHWAMKAFFTATSMIGFIASAGIVVRNSIILVDFVKLKIAEGMELKEAVIEAGVIRFRPMLLTSLAVIVGAGVILFDPIFQGLAISLISGQIASTLLSRVAVPVLYYLTFKRDFEIGKIKAERGSVMDLDDRAEISGE